MSCKLCKTPIKHNHVTRDIKPIGKCPGCDLYHFSEMFRKIKEIKEKTLTNAIHTNEEIEKLSEKELRKIIQDISKQCQIDLDDLDNLNIEVLFK